MEIYRNKFVVFTYEKENSLITFIWTVETETMTDDEYKDVLIAGVGLLDKYPTKFLLSSQKNKKYVVHPKIQEWVGKEALPKIFEKGIVKYAIVESENVVIQLATEQTVEEDETKEYGVLFFDDEAKARKWLIG